MQHKLLLLVASLMLFSSCIKDEPLSREADIIDVTIDHPAFITSVVSSRSVQLVITTQADYSKLAPIIEITPGAEIYPPSGTILDFSNGRKAIFRVVSEDKNYHKDYEISVVSKISLKHDFEEWTTFGEEEAIHPVLEDQFWASGNAGVAILNAFGVISITEYPTSPTTDCVEGKYAAKLQTLKGAETMFGNFPIFAGSLFRGKFVMNPTSPLKSLQLGAPHKKEEGKPTTFKGYYKYSPGKDFTGPDGELIPNKEDIMSLYAVIFKVDKGTRDAKDNLDGETIFTSERIVGRADWSKDAENIKEEPAINGFTKFSIPFIYTEELDFSKFDYRVTIVCSSSKDGDSYMGAVGSTLIIDELEIICDEIPSTESSTSN